MPGSLQIAFPASDVKLKLLPQYTSKRACSEEDHPTGPAPTLANACGSGCGLWRSRRGRHRRTGRIAAGLLRMGTGATASATRIEASTASSTHKRVLAISAHAETASTGICSKGKSRSLPSCAATRPLLRPPVIQSLLDDLGLAQPGTNCPNREGSAIESWRPTRSTRH